MTGTTTIHYLHIGKTAGTQIRHITDQISAQAPHIQFVQHLHAVRLFEIPAGEPYFFSIRSPIARFRSGFYSRKRKGYPRTFGDWSPDETLAFETFPEANDLAEALFDPGPIAFNAMQAMQSIIHTSMDQIDWFIFCGHFFRTRPPLAILRQEQFKSDLLILLKRLQFAGSIDISHDPVTAHANDYADIPDFSDKAIQNLRLWYAQDLEFYRHCSAWIEANQ